MYEFLTTASPSVLSDFPLMMALIILLEIGQRKSALAGEEKLTCSISVISFSACARSCALKPACAADSISSSFVGVLISSPSSSSERTSLFVQNLPEGVNSLSDSELPVWGSSPKCSSPGGYSARDRVVDP
jgi:hypothetical protein